MLAKVADINRSYHGWLISEKIDGMRAYWVPDTRNRFPRWGSLNQSTMDTRITGLWSRLWKPIQAPDWWLDKLPTHQSLDGELVHPKGWETTIRAVKGDLGWDEVRYWVFDSPGIDFNQNQYGALAYILRYQSIEWPDKLKLIQWQSKEHLKTNLINMLDQGSEGLMIRDPSAPWENKRSKYLLKLKGVLESEAVVVGINPGEGKYSGMVGSLRCIWKGTTINISGLTDEERMKTDWIGKAVQFKYRSLSDAGQPKEARYIRTLNV
jgi:DNA ligase-1